MLPESMLPQPLRDALAGATGGATGAGRLVIHGLEGPGEPAAMAHAIGVLPAPLTGYAPLWHIAKAVRGADPVDALRIIRGELDLAVERSVAAAAAWAKERGGVAAVAPSSSVVSQVLRRLEQPLNPATGQVALAGADAIGPDELLNIVGTRELARRLPTLVVTTSHKLVPGEVFAGLGAPVFERIPLDAFAGFVID